jgi:hypothetical protein
MHPLVEEAAKKAAIAWLEVDGQPPYPVWCLWQDGALYVIHGLGEQPAPGLADAATIVVRLRGDHGGQIVAWTATARTIRQTDDLWDTVAPALAAKRLNASGSAEDLAQRWAEYSTLTQLSPAGEDVLPLGDASLAAPPRPTPATNRSKNPFRLHRVRKNRR